MQAAKHQRSDGGLSPRIRHLSGSGLEGLSATGAWFRARGTAA